MVVGTPDVGDLKIFPVTHKDAMLRIMDNVVPECGEEVHSSGTALYHQGPLSVRELHAGVMAHCEAQSSDLPPITQVDKDFIIFNDRSANVTEIWAQGTHLITFDDRATINQDVLSIPYLNRLNESNLFIQERRLTLIGHIVRRWFLD